MSSSPPASPASDTHGSARVLRTEGLSADETIALLAMHHEALANGTDVLKDDRRTAVTRVPHEGDWLCVKEYRRESAFDRLKDALRRSRASRAWAGSRLLASRDIDSPAVVALVVSGSSSYLLSRFISNGTPLDRLITGRFAFGPAPRAKHALLHALGLWLRGIHDRGIYHDDWSPKNILAAEEASGWRFWLLDTESISARKRINARRRGKNLAQLSDAPYGVTATDRIRVLRAYAPSGEHRRLLRSILPAARRRERNWVRVHADALKSKEQAR